MTVFGLQNIHAKLYVTYAAFTPLNGGVVDVFDTDGHMLQRLASNDPSGPLEQPWAVTSARYDFGRFSHALLVGNFGDGRISAFNPKNGKLLGQLADCHGKAISDGLGLWALASALITLGMNPAACFLPQGLTVKPMACLEILS